jgi:putative DNA primase/helicase
VKPKAYKGENENGGVIGQFNQNYEPGNILEANSYKKAGKRWRCPNSTSGIPGVIMLPDSEPARVYSHHGSDPLADGHSHDAFSVFCQIEHNGNMAAAVSSAAKLLGIDREPLALDEQSQKMVDGIMGKTVKNLSDHVKPKE